MENQEIYICLKLSGEQSFDHEFENEKKAIESFKQKTINLLDFNEADTIQIKDAHYWNRDTDEIINFTKDKISILENKINDAIEKMIAE